MDAAREELRKTEPKSARLLFPVLSLLSHDCLSNAQFQIVEEREEDEDSEQKKFWFDYENRGENGHEKTEPDGKRGICSILLERIKFLFSPFSTFLLLCVFVVLCMKQYRRQKPRRKKWRQDLQGHFLTCLTVCRRSASYLGGFHSLRLALLSCE